MFLLPKPGLIVRDPVTRVPLPREGRTVTTNLEYWWRRLRDGDVIQGTPAVPAIVVPTTPAA